MSDLTELDENYDRLHEAGESWESITGRVEAVGDKRLAAHLRERAAGSAAEAVTTPPAERTAGNKAVTVQEAADAQTAAASTPEGVAAELAAEGGEK